ncbi:MAG: beta-ketoacyl-ACP synthase III [Pseudomonadota bacterium]
MISPITTAPTIRARIIGTGGYLPGAPVTNDDLAQKIDTTDAWIAQRTGIRQRHIASEDEQCSDLAIKAGQVALKAANVTPEGIDAVVVATTTPDLIFPSTATRVQAELGIPGGMAFDVQAVCAGFVYALTVAQSLIVSGQSRRLLLVGAETYSRILDWSDRRTCVLFGDGAGAVVLERCEGDGTCADTGVLSAYLDSDGRLRDVLYVQGGINQPDRANALQMNGREVFRHAVVKLAQAAETVIAQAGVRGDEIDWFVPHQANLRIISAAAERVGVAMDRVVLTVDRHANTSAASVPLALDVAVRDGRIQPGHLLLFEALGGGLTWGAALVRM